MKKILFINILLAFIFSTQICIGEEKNFKYTGNPLVRDRYTADPSARVWADGRLYVYPSQDQFPSRGCDLMDKYHVYSTDDMVNWVDHGQILEAADVPWREEELADNATFMWAPDCIYRDGKYYFYYPHPSKNPWNSNWKIGVAVSDKPASDFVPEPTWIEGTASEIDPCVFIDDDGQAYLYNGGGGRCFVTKLKDNMLELDGEPQRIPSTQIPRFHEGPWVFKRENKYYFMYPADNGSEKGDEMRYSMSDSPMGPWTYKGVVLEPTGCGTSHGSIVEFKDQWYLFYHNQMLSNNGTLRSICFDKLYFNEDGTMQLVKQTRGLGAPYGGTAKVMPGTIEAEDFNEEGPGIAYHDATRMPPSTEHRSTEYVDIEEHRSGVAYISKTETGEWINYTFEVANDGIFDIDFYAAAAQRNSTADFYIKFDQIYIDSELNGDETPEKYTLEYAAVNNMTPYTVENISLSKGIHTMTFYPVGDLNFDKFVVKEQGTAIQNVETKKENILVYPNPTDGVFQINAPDIESVWISDITGKIIFKDNTIKSNYSVNISEQACGIYILSVQLKNQVYQQKLIKKAN